MLFPSDDTKPGQRFDGSLRYAPSSATECCSRPAWTQPAQRFDGPKRYFSVRHTHRNGALEIPGIHQEVMRSSRITIALAAHALAAGAAHAQVSTPLDSAFIAGMEWRSIGPANTMGRVTDVEGIPSPSRTFYFASVAGGIWKTTNNGVTFRPLFQNEKVVAMGDLAIAPSDTLQVWAGTGEEDSRNSISPGMGIYKSADGGLTWKLMGLEKTQAIARIVVHPTNPNTVWVAALGAIWNANPERGIYKTTDGGQTWRQVKFVSDKAGFVDLVMDPSNPNVLWASSWERVRGPYFLQSGGPGSALWKSTDGGETWTEVKGNGFPETMKGRIGIAIAASNPRIMYTLVEAEDGPDGKTKSGLYRSDDGGATWTQMNTENTRPFYYNQVRVDPEKPDRVYWSSTPMRFSEDGGKTVKNTTDGVHVDDHALWIDPKDPDRWVVGNDGGIAITFDRGGNFWFPNSVPIGQFYAVSYDMGTPYRVCGGLQDNYSWCGPSRKARGNISNYDWFSVSGGDGFVTQQDPRDPDIIYSESQGGNIGRLNYATGERYGFQKPSWRDVYRQYQDSIALLWPDTTKRPSGDVRRRIDDLRRRASADSAALELRYNWNTPYLISPHDADVLYIGANRVLKSSHRGQDIVPISPDLTKGDTMKIRVSTVTTGGITRDATGAETYATIVSLAESPRVPGMIWAGTDDGNVWLTRNDGGTWTNLTPKFKGLVPDTTYVSRIEPSHHVDNRVYITFDNHRNGDFKPYVFVSDDGGGSFRSINANLPAGGIDFTHVVREDPVNPNLLFVGTDVGLYVSVDRGQSWQRFMTGFPTTPVHDLKIHPRDHELIAGTHGRSIWIADIAPLEQLDRQVLAADAFLFTPSTASQFGEPPVGGNFIAQNWWETPSPDYGAKITYWIGQATSGRGGQGGGRGGQAGQAQGGRGGAGRGAGGNQAHVVITNARGDTLADMTGPTSRGIHSVNWNFRGQAPPSLPLSPSERRDSLNTERRLAVVTDSIVKAGTPKDQVDRAVTQLRSAAGGGFNFGGRGGRGGNQASGEWQERPAEVTPTGGRGGRGGGAGGGEAGEEAAEQTPQQQQASLVQRIQQLVQPGGGGRGRGRGGFGFGGGGIFPSRPSGQPPLADPGVYTVSLTVGGTTMTRTLLVERGDNAPTGR
jgi:photosystem II stability/assembly factor-like uncharacterized protein